MGGENDKLRFVDEFVEWSKEERDRYTLEILRWATDVFTRVARERNILKKKRIVEKAFSPDRAEKFYVALAYAVKQEFREDFLKMLNALRSAMSV